MHVHNIYKYIYIFFFLILSSIMVYPKRLGIVPCAVSRTSWLIHSKCTHAYGFCPNPSLSLPAFLPFFLLSLSPSLLLAAIFVLWNL